MPYYRKRRYRKRRYKKKSSYGGYLSTASKALAVAYSVKKLLNTERKHITLAVSQEMNTAGTVSASLCNPQLSDAADGRDGRQVKVTQINMKARVRLSGTTTSDTCRVCIIHAKTSVLPTATLIMDTADVISMRNLDETKLYNLIYDKTFSLNTDTAGSKEIFLQHVWKPMSLIKYDLGGNTPQWGHYFLLCIGGVATGANATDFIGNFRSTFVDN